MIHGRAFVLVVSLLLSLPHVTDAKPCIRLEQRALQDWFAGERALDDWESPVREYERQSSHLVPLSAATGSRARPAAVPRGIAATGTRWPAAVSSPRGKR